MEFTLLGAAFVAIVAVWVVLYWEGPRGNAAVTCSRSLWDLVVSSAIVGLFAGRVWALVAGGGNPFAAPVDLLIVRAGVATGPAALAAVLFFAWQAREDISGVADAVAPAALAGVAGWHGSCMMRDGCLGVASDLPWAFAQAGSQVTRHPVELYAAALLGLGVVALIVVKQRRPRAAPGAVASLALGLASLVRLATEPFRLSLGGGPVWWYAAGMVIAAGLFVLSSWRQRNASSGSAVHSQP